MILNLESASGQLSSMLNASAVSEKLAISIVFSFGALFIY
jgi:hypothetical protein